MIKPVNSYLLIEMEAVEERTSGGLYMPQGSNANAVDILVKGIVKAVSDKNADKVNIGDTVYYNKHAFTKIPGNEGMVFVRMEDLYGICS